MREGISTPPPFIPSSPQNPFNFTSTNCVMTPPEVEVSWEDHENSMSELEQVKAKLRWTEENLRAFSEGVRLIASQLKEHHRQNRRKSNDSDTETNATAEESIHSSDGGETVIKQCFSLEPDELSGILDTDRMAPLPAADLLALQNASQMVKEHARLSFEEATTAVEDTVEAQAAAREWQRRALAAEAEVNKLRTQNSKLRAHSHKLETQKKVLVKEVRKIHKQLASAKKDDMLTQLQSYVASALNIHEQQLKGNKISGGSGIPPPITPCASDCTELSKHSIQEQASASFSKSPVAPSPKPPSQTAKNRSGQTRFKPFDPLNIGGALAFLDPTYNPDPQPNAVKTSQEKKSTQDLNISRSNSAITESPITFVGSEPGAPEPVDPHMLRSLALPSMYNS